VPRKEDPIMARDLRQALDQEPEADARTWKPAVNDEIVGRVVRRDQVANKFKPDTPTERLVVHTDNGEHRTVYCNHTASIGSAWRRCRPSSTLPMRKSRRCIAVSANVAEGSSISTGLRHDGNRHHRRPRAVSQRAVSDAGWVH
jgi:hypothetical protein